MNIPFRYFISCSTLSRIVRFITLHLITLPFMLVQEDLPGEAEVVDIKRSRNSRHLHRRFLLLTQGQSRSLIVSVSMCDYYYLFFTL